jgi:hypothetical protein
VVIVKKTGRTKMIELQKAVHSALGQKKARLVSELLSVISITGFCCSEGYDEWA